MERIKVAYTHNHTIYSEKDSIASSHDYILKIIEMNKASQKYEIVGFYATEHGNIHSMTDTYKDCKDNGLLNSPAIEFYHTTRLADDDKDRFHLVLTAVTEEGKINLFTLATLAGFNKQKGRTKEFPRIDEEMMKNHGKGIIASTACMGGKIPKLITAGQYDDAKKLALKYASYFDELYLEIQPHELPDQLMINEALVRMSSETGLPLVITTDSHYVEKDDKKYHDTLKRIDDPTGKMIFTVDAYLMPFEDLEAYCLKYNIPFSAIENTGVIAEKSRGFQLEPKDKKGFMPTFPCPPGYTEETYLREIAMDHLMEQLKVKKFPDAVSRYRRLEYELDVISNQGFAGYFLILWDWFKWCRDNDIIMGKGRGSAAGSLVCYVLNITSVDPIENGFIFERFMSPLRVEMPDVDSDVSKRDRPRAMQYLLQKYGMRYVAQIITFIKYKIRGIIKAAGSSLGIDPKEVGYVTALIPPSLEGIDVTYETLMDIRDNPDKYEDMSPRSKNQCLKAMDAIDELFQKHPDLYLAVQKLNGAVATTGLHAGGAIISGLPLAGNLPMTKGSATSVFPVLQINMNDVPFYNLLKIDVLGLRTLDMLYDWMKLSGKTWDWYDNEDWLDPEVYEFLRQGHTTDVFQFSSASATRMVKAFRVNSLGDLTAVNAGNRPGPLSKDKDTGVSAVEQYEANVVSGTIESLDPRIDDILKDTQGCIWYQEQCLFLGQVMAGYDLGSADLKIRKPMGKKQLEKIPELETEFIYGKKPIYDANGHVVFFMPDGSQVPVDLHAKPEEVRRAVNDLYNANGHPRPSNDPSTNCEGCIARGFSEELAIKIFNAMKAFAKYAFNKSHSGAYAAIAFKCASASCHGPVEWAVACAGNYDNNDKIRDTISALKKRGYKVLPPSISKSFLTFTVEKTAEGEDAMRYGLVDIPYVGARAVGLIKLERDKTPFLSFDDFYNRCTNSQLQDIRAYLGFNAKGNMNQNPINKSAIVNLIKAGAFDEFEENRYKLLNHYLVDIRKESEMTEETLNASTKKKEKTVVSLPLDENEFSRKTKLAMEKSVMGGYISEHPLEPFPYVDFSTCPGGIVSFAGIINSKTSRTSKKGNGYVELQLELKDSSTMVARLFNKTKDEYAKICKQGKIVVIQGKFDTKFNSVTVDRVAELIASNTPQLTDEEAFEGLMPVMPDLASTQDFSSLSAGSVVDFFGTI